MIPSSVDYTRASSVTEAIRLLTDNPDAKILAGGHSLIPAMKLRLNAPSLLIDIARIPELRFISDEGDKVVIGAASTHHDIISNEAVQDMKAMIEAGELIGDTQVRNMGTLGGSIAHADPSADWPAVLLALGASIQVQGPNGERSIAANEFFLGFFMTALDEGEIVTAIHIPKLAEGQQTAYRKFMQPASRFAIVGCGVSVTVEGGLIKDAKVAFTGVSDAAFLDEGVAAALIEQPVTLETIEAAANAAAEGDIHINEDHFSSQAYRKHLAKVYAKRALAGACGLD
ncbi:xanthine dehydrogenase family protein subunit M [Runella sp. MFBS21]|uniref:FAD binding domain-containing protein n=1 Tax=Runella sp. MFBS21 TaxID=3034018 RepID=UPI0023F8951F|nr:xanthine dehydrogenase family protein subunit M [Runella sp. MFBS21]MDF7819454.1 xanthine dehydrogenase family protein subunit M [Runella sp. MFBS21]